MKTKIRKIDLDLARGFKNFTYDCNNLKEG